jgi:tetratricopeptide (TPR) repeat protein
LTWVLWIHAASAARLEHSVRQNLEDLKVPRRADPAFNAFQLLRGWLQDNKTGKWLLILDNVDDARYLLEPPSTFKQQGDAALNERILDYFPASNQGSILVTSRTTAAALKVVERRSVVPVQPMGTEHAVELLRTKLEFEHTQEEALKLVEALDFMPLAINQAAAYISQEWPRCSVQQYLDELVESDMAKLSLLNLDDGDLRRDKEATNSIIATWQISFNQILTIRPTAANLLLSFMSFFDRQSIPERILRDCRMSSQIPEQPSETAAQGFDLDVRMLRSYSLITAPTAETFTMHSLVQFTTRKWVQARSEEEFWSERFIYTLGAAFPDEIGKENWSTCTALYPHIKIALSLKPADRNASRAWACLAYKCAIYASLRGLTADVRTMATSSMDELTRLDGQESILTLRSMVFLAGLTLEEPPSATKGHLQAQVVEISKKVSGEDTIMTATCKGMLAESYSFQGRYKEVEEMHLELLATLRYLLGEEDPVTLYGMIRFAATCMSQKQYVKAADLLERVAETGRRTLGIEHHVTLNSTSNLALVYVLSGKFEIAAALFTQTLDIEIEMHGPEHPETLRSMNCLAFTFGEQKLYDQAISLSTRVLVTQMKVLGPEHQSTSEAMSSLAKIYRAQGSYDKAIELGSHGLEIIERVCGPEDAATLRTMVAFAGILHDTGRRQSACDLMELCVARSLERLGPRHHKIMERQQLAKVWRKELLDSEERKDGNDADGEPMMCRTKSLSNACSRSFFDDLECGNADDPSDVFFSPSRSTKDTVLLFSVH